MAKLYLVSATCDWGIIFSNKNIEAASWAGVYRQAGKLAASLARKRPKKMSISIQLIGSGKKQTPETTPEIEPVS